MLLLLMTIMVVLLLLGFPMMVPLIVGPLLVALIYLDLPMNIIMQQMIAGISPYVLLCVPMFIFAADMMTKGRTSNRLLDFVGSFIGHLRGGYGITTAAACTLFGSISGSTQATVVAVGTPMRERMKKVGYKDSHATALIINASDIALMIPPSIGMIIYCSATGTSVGDVFIAGIVPGLLMFAAFAIYSIIYAKVKNIPLADKATWKERLHHSRKVLLPLGFPVIIIGGIYFGLFGPTEAAAISVLYAFILEVIIYRSIHIKQIPSIALSTGLVTAAVFILVAGGQAFSYVISLARIPETIATAVLGTDPSALTVLFFVSLFFFIGCMFVDPIVVILTLTPIFAPAAIAAGIDPVHLGIIITFQAALGSATPPFGVDIFTASAVFNRSYLDVIRGTPPFIIMLVGVGIIITLFEDISLLPIKLMEYFGN